MSKHSPFRAAATLALSLLVAVGPVAAVAHASDAAPTTSTVTSVDTVASKKITKGASLGTKKITKGASLG